MSWLYSRALVEFSEASSSDGEPYAQSSTTPTPQAFLWRDKTTDAWNRFPSGMTCEHLTASRGEDVLTSFLEALPAKTSVAPIQGVKDSTEKKADSGRRCTALFARYHPASSSLRIVQISLIEGWDESCQTWPRWGTMHNGECWERTQLAPRTSEKGSGFWQTPVADDSVSRAKGKYNSRGEPKLSAQVLLRSEGGGTLNPTWVAWLMGWPIGFTDLSVSATDKFQQWLQLHSDCLERGGQHDAGRIQHKRNPKRELHPNHARKTCRVLARNTQP